MKDIEYLINNNIDVKKSLELFGDLETYNDTLKDFLDNIDDKLNEIKKYKELTDMPNYAILVHSLKSDCKYLGFTDLAAMSYEHELKSKANDLTFVVDNYDNLIKETKRIANIIKKYLGEDISIEKEEPKTIAKDKTIIVVDDSDIIRNFIYKIFDNEFDVVVAKDGREAIDIIELNTSKNIIGMLLDLKMPNFDGFEVLNYFEKNSLFNQTPVSIITGDDSPESISKAYTYPITSFLTKPFNERDVKIVIEKMEEYKSILNQ